MKYIIIVLLLITISVAIFAQSNEIVITFNTYGTWETGLLEYAPLDMSVQCWFAGTSPMARGRLYTGLVKDMPTKIDSVTKGPRRGIRVEELMNRGIWLHEGNGNRNADGNFVWSDGCIVIPHNQINRIMDHIGEGNYITIRMK